jgi:hypothetical protein
MRLAGKERSLALLELGWQRPVVTIGDRAQLRFLSQVVSINTKHHQRASSPAILIFALAPIGL